MLEHIYVVVGSGTSDIGKGWLTASIANVLPKALPVKIDPFLNIEFPEDIGIPLGGKFVSEDLATYMKLGLPVFPESNILNGSLLLELLHQPATKLERGSFKKLTFSDLSAVLAQKLLTATQRVPDCRNLVIEVGGIVTDREHIWIPNALKLLGNKTGITPGIIILSYIEHAEVGFPIKTQHVRHAIRETQSRYGLPIYACFVRRRYVPSSVTTEQIRQELANIAFETQLSPNLIVFEDNFASVFELRDFVKTTTIFDSPPQTVIVSACLMGIPCRWNGSPDAREPELMRVLGGHEVITICPELLAGFNTPREPCEIVGGDGRLVLDGKARVLSKPGEDLTKQFVAGARKAAEIVRRYRPARIILCDRSPSCGGLQIYDGSFSGKVKAGCGILPAILAEEQIPYISNTEMPGGIARPLKS